MAEGKNKVIWYTNWSKNILKLSDEEAGKLIKHFSAYVLDLDPEATDRLTELLFDPIEDTLKRDLKSWESKQATNRANGAKGGRPPKPKETQPNPNKPNGLFNNPEKGVKDKVKVKVKVNDMDSVKVIDIVKEETKLLCSISTKHELDNDIDRMTFAFWELFKKNLTEAGVNKTTTLDKAKLETWRNPIRLAIDTDERTREEFEEVFKFLQINDFWKKNIQSTTKLREQFERLLVEARTKPPIKEDKHKLTEEYKARLAEKLRS